MLESFGKSALVCLSRRDRRRAGRWCAAGMAAALACFCLPVRAQQTTADVVGTVQDSSGAVVAGANVTIENHGTNEVRSSQTNPQGEYIFTLLPIGHYTVKVDAPGFKSFIVPDLALAAGDRARVDAALQLGQQSETIEVTAQPAALQTDSSILQDTVTEKAVQDLPVNGRNFVTLAQVTAGANSGPPDGISSGTRPDDRRPTASVSVNGQGDLLNNQLLDGLDNNERNIGTIGVRPSIDAIAELRVQSNLYSADVGRTAGGVINILTKSGTNSFHGSAYEYLRNDALDARDFFALSSPEYRQNQFGGSIGGPIRKNKTFFFADVEELRMVQGQVNTTTVPTAYEEAHPGDFSDIGGPVIPSFLIDPIGAKYFALYPTPNRPGAFNNYTSAFNEIQNNTTFDSRVDHHIDDNDALFARFSRNSTYTLVPGAFPEVDGVQPGGNVLGFSGPSNEGVSNAQLNYTRVFSPQLLMELKAGFSRIAINTYQLDDGTNDSDKFGLNGVNVNSDTSGLAPMYVAGYAGLGDSPYLPIHDINNTFQYNGSVVYTRGNHSLKVGATLIRRQLLDGQSDFGQGFFVFAPITFIPGLPASNPVGDLLMGLPIETERSNRLVYPALRFWEPSVYVQDDWRATRWLTLNIGVRYDVFTPPTEAHNNYANFDPATAKLIMATSSDPTAGVKTDYSNLAPRFGFAATAPHGLVIRGGFGLSFFPDDLHGSIVLDNAPYVFSWGPVFVQPLSAGIPVPVPSDPNNLSGVVFGKTTNFRNAYIEQYNLTVQKDFAGNVASLSYVGELGRELLYGNGNLNYDLPAPSPLANPASRAPYASILPNVTSISMSPSGATSSYQALQATLLRRYSKGLTLDVNYTWAHGIDDTEGASGTTNPYGLLPWALGTYDRGNSDLDVRHRIAVTTTYDLPFGKSLNGWRAAAIKGWQVNSIAYWQTGLPFTVTDANAQINLPGITSDRPDRIATGTVSNPDLAEWFNPSAFVPQPFGTAGTSGKNILYGPHQRRVDLSLFKDFPIREALKLQFRAECYNISNTPSFASPNSELNTAGFGSISSTTTGVGPRELQFALKLLF